MNNDMPYQDHETGARYFRNGYYYAIVGDETRGYCFALFYGMIRIGTFYTANTLDELLTRLDHKNTHIIYNDYSEVRT